VRRHDGQDRPDRGQADRLGGQDVPAGGPACGQLLLHQRPLMQIALGRRLLEQPGQLRMEPPPQLPADELPDADDRPEQRQRHVQQRQPQAVVPGPVPGDLPGVLRRLLDASKGAQVRGDDRPLDRLEGGGVDEHGRRGLLFVEDDVETGVVGLNGSVLALDDLVGWLSHRVTSSSGAISNTWPLIGSAAGAGGAVSAH
jgi:hypothetical protein